MKCNKQGYVSVNGSWPKDKGFSQESNIPETFIKGKPLYIIPKAASGILPIAAFPLINNFTFRKKKIPKSI